MANDPSILGRTPAGLGYQQSIGGCLSDSIGARGVTEPQLASWLEKLAPYLEDLREDYRTGRLPLLRIPEDTEDLAVAQAALTKLTRNARAIVFFGTGGSSLGGQALAQLGGWNIPGTADEEQKGRPRTRFYDNLDPATLEASLKSFELGDARFVVISKSGSTPETLVQALAALAAVKKAMLGNRIPELFLGVSEPRIVNKSNGLRDLFEGHGIPVLDHHPNIGGRFSVLTNVGLLAAMARGLDARAVRVGARGVIAELMSAKTPREFAPAVGASVAIALSHERGVRAQVMMPYSDRLDRFSHWFAQLWAESLGKDGKGIMPIACLGPVDQHSQLQLFMDGPREYLVTVVRVPTAGRGPRLDNDLARGAGLDYLAGKTVGDLVSAQAYAVPEALGQAGRPVRTFDLDRLDEYSVGALMMHLMLEAILVGRLLDVDPFDQPAVELAKVLTRNRVAALNV